MEGEKIELNPGLAKITRHELKTAKDHFHTTGYGKFDLIQKLLTPEILINHKPRIIKKLICQQFGLSPEEINNDTFWSWLRRNRKNLTNNNSLGISSQLNIESRQSPEHSNDWKNFIPSNPVMDLDSNNTIIKLVTHSL